MVYLVQREDCRRLVIADDIDPAYAAALGAARAAGVGVLCHACTLSPQAIERVWVWCGKRKLLK